MESKAKVKNNNLMFYSSRPLRRRRNFNRLFAVFYSSAIAALLYHHGRTLLTHPTSFLVSLGILASDLILAFQWLNSQAFRMNPVATEPYPEKLRQSLTRAEDFPALDVFICTADPLKEPPIQVAGTALSAMAYDYPAEKLSIYVSDDGWSELTLFALAEAAEFGKSWLPFCKQNRVTARCPESFFGSDLCSTFEARKIKEMYEKMKERVEEVATTKRIPQDHDHKAAKAFSHWTQAFTQHSHPPLIQVLAQTSEDKDVAGCPMPNLIYLSREKSSLRAPLHHFKAGALNALLRVSAVMTNGPMILTLDCDMISNDPSTPHKMLCYFMDTRLKPNLGYVQFPVCFDGLNNADIYSSEFKRPFHINPLGMNGLSGPDYFGTGTFFNRQAFHGNPSVKIVPEIPELDPDYVVEKPINDEVILGLAHDVARCDFENQTEWGINVGFFYGSLVEDYYTGYRLHCKGWKSVYCSPSRAAFLAEMPISLRDVVAQTKRWSVGLLEVSLSKYSTIIYGPRYLGPLMAHCYSYYAFGPMWSIPISIYAFLPQITMLNNVSIFPKVSEPRFFVYAFLFLGAYGQDLIEFLLAKGTAIRWWNDQRMWLIRVLSSDLFGTIEYTGNQLGITTRGFDVTNKVDDNNQRKRYNEGKFEFGVPSPMFVPLTAAAIINLAACSWGILQVLRGKWQNELNGQMLLTCFGVANSWPVYEAMAWRTDEGRIPTRIICTSALLASALFVVISVIINI
ncbi:cellulose synthase-like protein G3 [Andrographis paniculata]|uniref:cellulose synthase-like protein G3 n=1 Tax=Andrographis paniculata TaxID=175694 RepID=UPI0021E6F1E9|nr:cellulose synthase-like protein G3 [Andrographis paniculata]